MNFDHQMSLSKSKYWYSNNCLHLFKVHCSVGICDYSLRQKLKPLISLTMYMKNLHCANTQLHRLGLSIQVSDFFKPQTSTWYFCH